MKFSSVCVLGALSTTAAIHAPRKMGTWTLTGQPYVRVYSTASNPLRKCWLNQKQSYCPRDNAWGIARGYDKCAWSNGKCGFAMDYFRCPGSTGEGEICECNINAGYYFDFENTQQVPCSHFSEYEEYETEEYGYEDKYDEDDHERVCRHWGCDGCFIPMTLACYDSGSYPEVDPLLNFKDDPITCANDGGIWCADSEYEYEYENFREYENNEYEYESRCMTFGCLGRGSCLFEAAEFEYEPENNYPFCDITYHSEVNCANDGGLWCADFEYEYENKEYEEYEYENKEYEEYEYEYEHRFFCGYGSYLADDGMSCEVDLNTVCTGLTKLDAQGRHCVIDMEAIVQTVNDNGTPFECKTVGQGQDCKKNGANLAINTAAPTTSPTLDPTGTPTTETPTAAPTDPPTSAPTQNPTATPTSEPTESPTNKPTESPTKTPTVVPTNAPTDAPTLPTSAPTRSCSSIKYGGRRYKWNLCNKQEHCRVARVGRRNVCTATLPPTTLAPTAPTDSPTTGAPTILDVCKGKNRITCRNRVNKAKCLWARQGRRWTCKMKN